METLGELARKGAEGALPEMLRLLEAMCSVDCGTGFPASGSIQGTSYFDAPTPLEQVDHVLFGDVRLELPAAEP